LFDLLFQRPLFTEVIGRTPDAYNAHDAMDLSVAMRLGGVWIPYYAPAGWSAEKISDRVHKDAWGTTYEKDDAAWPLDAPVAFPLKTHEDLRHCTPPDPLAEARMNELNTAVAMNKSLGDKAVAVMGSVSGPLTISWYLLRYENICLTLYDAPKFLEELAEISVDFGTKMIKRIATTGVDAMIVADDYSASPHGLLRRAHFRAIYMSALEKIIDCIKSYNLPVFFHCCRCIHDYLEDLGEIAIDAIHICCNSRREWTWRQSRPSTEADFASSGTSIHQGLYLLAHRSKSRRRRLRRCGLSRQDAAMPWHQTTRFMTESWSRTFF
jgi:hypothetical protein